MREEVRTKLDKFWNWSRESSEYWLTRFILLRVLGFTYFFAFLSLFMQLKPLLGSNGLTPVRSFLPQYVEFSQFLKLPTVFWFNQSDSFMLALAFIGVLISFLVMIGFANVPMLVYNWFIYLSFVNVGQIWYSYGWEIQLVETGFLAIFLVPLLDPRPLSGKLGPPKLIIWLFRWLGIRIYLGSGLIKMKGVECWHRMTCLDRFFQTQPIPNPVSPFMHYLPSVFHRFGIIYNHFVQLIVPYSAIFENQYSWLRNWGGVLMLSLQAVLILVGNFAFLNWVTIVPVIAFFDDDFLSRFMPDRIVDRAEEAKKKAGKIGKKRHLFNLLLVASVIFMSVPVVVNLLSPQQTMNTSFSNWNFVNSYGAFGSVREARTEVVVEGTRSESLENAKWREYDFRHKPDQEDDPLTVIAPYQPRIAWQMWFASFSQPEREPWFLHLTWKLLHDDPQAQKLVKEDPFGNKSPEYIRARLYRFELQPPSSQKNWDRELIGTWMKPVSDDNRRLERFVKRRYK
ncbi:MAG: lipase maturation factor family protein [Candidatus Nanohaloarchaea archaeon]